MLLCEKMQWLSMCWGCRPTAATNKYYIVKFCFQRFSSVQLQSFLSETSLWSRVKIQNTFGQLCQWDIMMIKCAACLQKTRGKPTTTKIVQSVSGTNGWGWMDGCAPFAPVGGGTGSHMFPPLRRGTFERTVWLGSHAESCAPLQQTNHPLTQEPAMMFFNSKSIRKHIHQFIFRLSMKPMLPFETTNT